MNQSAWAAGLLAGGAAAGVAYVFLYPLLSGEARAEKRHRALVQARPDRRPDRLGVAANRREQVTQSLREIEARQSAQHKLTLDQRLAQAGMHGAKGRFFVFSGLFGLLLGVVLFGLSLDPLVGVAGLLVGSLALPRWTLTYLRNKRTARFLAELPNAIDVIVRGVRAGLPLGDCFRIVANEAQEPVRSEFRTVLETLAVGVPLGESVLKIYERVPVTEANFFAIVIGIQQKAGGNLAETLGNLSKVLRDRRKMRDKVSAVSMEAKASAGIIGTLPFAVGVLTYLASPRYIELLWTTSTGLIALSASGVWMLIGVAVMKKMISFKI